MKYCIIGTGALGGYYGGLLSKAGADVHFLVRSDYEQIRAQGLSIISPKGDFSLPKVNAYQSVTHMPKGEVIIVSVKAYSNPEIIKSLPSILTSDSSIILLQNGLGGEECYSQLVTNNRLFGGLSFICASKIGPGKIHHQDYGAIRIGEYNPSGTPLGISNKLQNIISDFRNAGVEATPVPDLLHARWEKLIWNIPFSGLSVIGNADTKRIISDAHALVLARSIIHDVALAANACGKPIDADFQQKMIDHTRTMVPYIPSIKIDFDNGKPMETEAIFGNPLRAAQKAGYAAPYVASLYRILKFLENNRGQ
jgi:2-dehydropantoate 2-reductase